MVASVPPGCRSERIQALYAIERADWPLWRREVDVDDGLAAGLAALAKLGSRRAIGLVREQPHQPDGADAMQLLLALAFGDGPPRVPPAISAPPSVVLTPPANAAERIRKIGLAFERHRYLARASAALLAYLNDQVALPEIWEQNRSLYSLCWFTDGVVSLISTGATLDSLDLRLLDVLAILGSAEQFIEAIARQERVAQAFDHLQRQQQRYPRLRGLRNPQAALALVRGSFVESGQPTPLGWLLLASMPERLEQALELRNQA